MRVCKAKDYEDMSKKAARILASQIILKPDSVLGLATGSTPEGMYKEIVNMYKNGDIDFSQIKTANLDEYKGITKDNEQSYYYFMNKHLFKHVNIKPENTNIPDGMAEDGEAEGKRYDEVVRKLGGVDLQVLGIGNNGHIGFNEPDEFFAKGTHQVALTQSTIEANARFFNSIDEVPKFAYSMGIQTIMSAHKILLMASGKVKADAIYNTIYGNITPKVPASILQLHPDVIIVADEEALSKVNLS